MPLFFFLKIILPHGRHTKFTTTQSNVECEDTQGNGNDQNINLDSYNHYEIQTVENHTAKFLIATKSAKPPSEKMKNKHILGDMVVLTTLN